MLTGQDKKNTIKDKVFGVGASDKKIARPFFSICSAAKLLSEAKEKEKGKDKDADLPHRHAHTQTFFQHNAFLRRLRANPRVTLVNRNQSCHEMQHCILDSSADVSRGEEEGEGRILKKLTLFHSRFFGVSPRTISGCDAWPAVKIYRCSGLC